MEPRLLSGTMPPALAGLSALRSLRIQGPRLPGTLPELLPSIRAAAALPTPPLQRPPRTPAISLERNLLSGTPPRQG